MGSFDMSCAVSDISLGGEQPVKLFFACEQPFSDYNGVYPCDRLTFCSFGIPAVYYDYGIFDIDRDSVQWKGFVRFIKSHAIVMGEGDNSSHEQAFDPDTIDQLTDDDDVFRLLSDHRIRIKSHAKPDTSLVVFPVAIHEKVYDACLVERESWQGVVNVESIVKMYNQRGMMRDISKQSAERMIQELVETDPDSGLIEIYREMLGTAHLPESYGTGMFFGGYIIDGSEMNQEVVDVEYAKIAMIEGYMMINNLSLKPSKYCGQDSKYEEHIAHHEMVLGVLEGLKQKCDEEY